MTNFTEKQRIQDEQYCFPYHYLDKQFEFYKKIIYADYLSLINRIIETIRPIEGMRLLDVGCGDGRLCYELSGKGAELTGVDYSVQAIAFARAFCPECRFDICDLMNLSYQEEFDIITMLEVLEHLPPDKISSVVEKLWQALKTNGRLVLSVPTTKLPQDKKHYQHFTLDRLLETIGSGFDSKLVMGHLKMGRAWRRFLSLKKWAELMWPLRNKPLVKRFIYYVEGYYKKHLESCRVEEAGRIIVVFRKKKS